MSEAAQHLRRVKSEFENHGIRNEVQITEHVAFLLLPEVRARWGEIRAQGGVHVESLLQQIHDTLQAQYVGLRIPQPPPVRQWGLESLHDLLTHLQHAFDTSPHHANWGAFFQREIRFELLKGSSGSQYPTPHHIANLMAALALTGLNIADVFDPTAGTSGLLAACRVYPHAVGLTGCDLDPQSAGIGSANLLLHGAKNATFHVGSALGYARSYDNHFSAVLMNPPFGGTRDTNELAISVGHSFGRSSATVLTALAWQCLQPGGRAAVLVPSGVLFGGGGEANLRQRLAEHNLEAIVLLPKGAYQPYSQVGANLLVFQKLPQGANTPTQPVWFFAPEGDGYDPGMGRDLTAEPAVNINDLPRVRDVILQTRANQWQTRLSLTAATILTARQQAEAGLPGVAVRVMDAGDGMRWKAAFLEDGLFASLSDNSNAGQGWLFESLTGQEQLAFSVLPDSAPANSWLNLVEATSWAANIPDTWQGEQDDISLTVNATTSFSLNKYDFSGQPQATVWACLLDEQGNPLTPWLGCDDAKLVDALDAEPEKNKLQAVPLRDGHNKRCGWLIDLTANTNDEAADAPRGSLLLRDGEEVRSYAENGRFYLTLDNGWITFTPTADSQVTFRTGQPITLPDNRRIDGFAVGPGLEGYGHHLFGLLVARSEFVDATSGNVGDLRPTRFFPEPEAVTLDAPANLLANIRRNQEALKDRVDVLLRTLGKQTSSDLEAADLPNWMTQMLGTKQRIFWTILAQQKADSRPAHFTVEHVKRWCADDGSLGYQEDDIQKQLDLFVNLGLIQQVHVKGDEREGDYYENLYRALTKGDILPESEE
ncbi:MAG TPA: N-6 DNA methylase [Chloroflexota bacterium]|nr:N-6 DNA methylase [Chloroflexota bacterium]